MAASSQAALEGLQFTDYCSVVTITTILYDYSLMFGREVGLIWRRPWSFMSSLYVIVRYLGIVVAIMNAIWGSVIYMPAPVRTITFKFTNWGSYVYMLALEVAMILRIFAMYDQRKKLLYILLALFLPVVVVELVSSILYFGPRNGMYVTETPLPGMQICTPNFSLNPLLYTYTLIPGIMFDAILATLAVARLVQHTADMEKTPGGCKVTVWVRMLARDSVLYFIGNLIYRSFNLIPLTNLAPIYRTLAQAFCAIEPFVLPPRLIISFREYHAQIVANSDAGRSMESMVFLPGDPNGNND